MQTLKYNNLAEFCKSENMESLNDEALCIIDIDGIFFGGLTDPHFWFSNIKKEYLDELAKIVEKNTNIWIFTDRNLFGFWGPYKKQLLDTLSENGTIPVKKYKGSKAFLSKADKLNRALILSAQKPGKESIRVVEKGLAKFSKVFYLAAQDLPLEYRDKDLVESLKDDTINLYFVDIRK